MANALFSSRPQATERNAAGGVAYKLSDEETLAQYVLTGTFNGTYYVSGETQLDEIKRLAKGVSPAFIFKLALYAAEEGRMKDTAVALVCILIGQKEGLLARSAATSVIRGGKSLRLFVQMMRSGQFTNGKSLGSTGRKIVQRFVDQNPDWVWSQSTGSNPTFKDVIKLAHPKPATKSHEALFGYILGKAHDPEILPLKLRALMAFDPKTSAELPPAPYEMLASLPLEGNLLKAFIWQMTYPQLRQSLNMLAKRGAFEDKETLDYVVNKLRQPSESTQPFQLFSTSKHTEDLPFAFKDALADAVEKALTHVPELAGRTLIAVDCSGSMSNPITGNRGTASSKIECREAAALMAAALWRKNPGSTKVVLFGTDLIPDLDNAVNPRDSLKTITQAISKVNAGGTNTSLPLWWANGGRGVDKTDYDNVILISDNEGWVQSHIDYRHIRGTGLMGEWEVFRVRNPQARMAIIDITPGHTSQAPPSREIAHIGGFNDNIWGILEDHFSGKTMGIAERVKSYIPKERH